MSTAPIFILIGAFILFQVSIFYGHAGVKKLNADQRTIFTENAGSGWLLLVLFAVFFFGIWVVDLFLKLLLMLGPVVVVAVSGFRSTKQFNAVGLPTDFVRRMSRMNFMFSAGAFGFVLAAFWPIFCACVLN